MTEFAGTPKPPYYAVVFSSVRSTSDDGYAEMAEHMAELAARQPGFLGLESAREQIGITVSYWTDLESIRAWKRNVDHQVAQKRGKRDWYAAYRVRIARVEREYGLQQDQSSRT